MDVCEGDKSVIQDLLETPFSRRSLVEKLKIIKNGRPCPPLCNLKSVHKDKRDTYTRNFQVSQYDLYPWLCGCKNLNKLFCWPCLLFSKGDSAWSSAGFDKLNSLCTSQKKHRSSATHLQCTLDLLHFRQQRTDETLDSQRKFRNSKHNKMVCKNREVLKRLIDVTCHLVNQELPFRGHDESDFSLNRGNYIELLQLLKEYDTVLKDHIETATVFSATSSAIQNDLIQSVHDVVLDEITIQIQNAPFVAIMLDEASDTETVSQLCTVLRYVHEGKIEERFVGFTDVSTNRCFDGLFNHAQSVIFKFNLKTKLVAQTYDGASVMSGDLHGLQAKVLETCPHALHMHCYAHILNLVLSQSLNNIPECKVFFASLNGITTFTSHSSRRMYTLTEHLLRKIPSLALPEWSFSSCLVNMINEHRVLIIEYFEDIEKQDAWSANDKMAAIGYRKFLRKFETVFLLKLFSTVFAFSDILYNVLQTKSLDVIFCATKINEFQEYLHRERDTGFQPLWKSSNDLAQPREIKRMKCSTVDSVESRYRMLFYEIIDNLLNNLKVRFLNIEKLEFFGLLNCEKFDVYKLNSNFPDHLISKLIRLYEGEFDTGLLKNELMVLYGSEDIKGKSPYEVLQWLHGSSMATAFEQTYKLANLISTIPAITASAAHSFSAIRRIRTYLHSTQGQDRLCQLSLLSMEKALLAELKKTPNFYDLVIAKFTSINRRAEFHFK